MHSQFNMATERVSPDTEDDTLDLTDVSDRGTKRKISEIEEKSPYEDLICERGFHDISKRIGHEWPFFLLELGIRQSMIEQYVEDHQQVKQRIYRGLCDWKAENQGTSPESLTDRMFDALRKIEHQNVIDDICSEYKIQVKVEEMDTMENEVKDEKEESDVGETEPEDTGQISDIDEDKDCNHMDVDILYDRSTASPDDEVDMRSYQLELARDASKGNNAIVLAGTGSGKTRIAIYLMKRHLDANPNAKIVFMARTIPLVAQQFNAIRKILPERYKSKMFKASGEDINRGEFHLILKNERFNIAVITPQKLVNSLKESQLSISELSMLVFDECHHTKKGNPYNTIMKFYREVKRGNTGNTPQIVGLSATYGTDKAKTKEDALQSLVELMARMDVKSLSTVVRYKEEYEKYVVTPEDKTIPMQIRDSDSIKENIEGAMKAIEEDLIQSELDTWGMETRKLLYHIPEDRNDMKYQNWVQRLKYIARSMLKDHPKDGRFALARFAHLEMYFEALELNKILDPSDVSMLLLCKLDSQYFTRSEECQTEGEKKLIHNFKSLRKDVKRCVMKGEGKNPNVTNIVQIVKDIFQEKGNDSRFIIYVKTRSTAVLLSNLLNTKQSLKCTFLIGHGKSTDHGLSQDEQRIVMRRLNRGDIHGIVATSVAEEGLDISNCNVVIRYNAVGNEISRIQTRGRSRKAGGKYIVIADSRNTEREAINIEREYLMKMAIGEFLLMSENIIATRLDNAHKEIWEIEQVEDMKKQSIADSKSDEEFDLICGFCGKSTLSSNGIRCYKENHYVVVDSSFYKNLLWRPHKKPVNYDGINKTHKVYGKCCENDWGIGCTILNTRCVVIKLPSFLIKGKSYTKWKNVPYRVKAFNEMEDIKQLRELKVNTKVPN